MATKEDSKVFDVAKPGKTAATETSKPVIVGHKPMAQDPMVKGGDDASTATIVPVSGPGNLSSGRGKTIQPTNDIKAESPKPKSDDEAEAISVTNKSTTTKVATKNDETEVDDPKTEEKSPDVSAKKEEPVINDSLPELDDDGEENDAEKSKAAKKREEEEKELAKQQALQKLVEEKKYYLPIGEAAHKRNSALLILVVVVLLVLVGAYLAVDAGLLKTNFTLPLDLIKN